MKKSSKPILVRVVIDANSSVALISILHKLKKLGLEVHRGAMNEGQGLIDGEVPSIESMSEMRRVKGVTELWPKS